MKELRREKQKIWQTGQTYQAEVQIAKNPLEQTYARMNHIAMPYAKNIVIYGGTFSEGEQMIDCRVLHLYMFEAKQWIKISGKLDKQAAGEQGVNNNLVHFSAQYGIIIGTKLYLFGEGRLQGKTHWESWRFNFQNNHWSQFSQKGDVPKLYQGSSFVHLEGSWIVMYGGLGLQGELNNDLRLFNVQTGIWSICQGNYRFMLRGRYHCALAVTEQRLFISGGYSKGDKGVCLLDDLYEIQIILPTKIRKLVVNINKIICQKRPKARAEHKMFSINKGQICLIGGVNQEGQDLSLWNFNRKKQEWKKVCTFLQLRNIEGFSITPRGKDLIISGGQNLQTQQQRKFPVTKLMINWHEFNLSVKQKNTNKIINSKCPLCIQRQLNFMMNDSPYSATQLLSNMRQNLEFPFNAFGLLTDNSILLGAERIIINIEGERGQYYIKVQDNGKCTWNEKSLIRALFSYGVSNSVVLAGYDKRARKIINRDNSIRQYGCQLKLAAFRLGKRFLLILHCGANILIFFSCKRGQSYEMDYYVLNGRTKELIDSEMVGSRVAIQTRYSREIKHALHQKWPKNAVFIFDTILDEPSSNLNVDYESIDLILGDFDKISTLNRIGYNLNECIDVSFKAYLSLLYLRSEASEISVCIDRHFNTIVPQAMLEKVDRMSRMSSIIELQQVIEIQFKVMELYFIKELKKNINFFSNGVLIYCKNRLINRFKPKLGQLVDTLLTEDSYFNHLPFFGYVQLPESVPTNAFKTGVQFNQMTDRMESRFKFVQEAFKKKINTVIVSQTHQEASIRREKVIPNLIPTKQLPKRNRGHYGERNWDELPDRFEMTVNRTRCITRRTAEEKVEILEEKVAPLNMAQKNESVQ